MNITRLCQRSRGRLVSRSKRLRLKQCTVHHLLQRRLCVKHGFAQSLAFRPDSWLFNRFFNYTGSTTFEIDRSSQCGHFGLCIFFRMKWVSAPNLLRRHFGWTLREPRTELTPANYHYIPLWLHGAEPSLEEMTLRSRSPSDMKSLEIIGNHGKSNIRKSHEYKIIWN